MDKNSLSLKINIQKTVKLSVFLVVFSIVLLTISPVALAAAPTWRVYKPEDYVKSFEIDGTDKRVYFDFPIDPRYRLVIDDKVVVPSSDANSFASDYFFEWNGLYLQSFVFGAVNWQNAGCQGGVLDVRELANGAVVTITAKCSYEFIVSSGPVSGYQYMFYFLYDANGNYLRREVGERIPFAVENTGGSFAYSFTPVSDIVIDPEVAYICPIAQISCTNSSNNGIKVSSAVVESWGFSVDFNMIYEQSLIMNAIQDKVGDINEELGNLNDKADDIISGGEAGDKLNDALSPSSPFGDASDDLDDAIGDFNDATSKLPTTPKDPFGTDTPIPTSPKPVDPGKLPGVGNNIPSTPEKPTVANPDSVDDYVDIAGNFLDWENSGLTYMYAPMVLSVTLAIVFYTVFGKA